MYSTVLSSTSSLGSSVFQQLSEATRNNRGGPVVSVSRKNFRALMQQRYVTAVQNKCEKCDWHTTHNNKEHNNSELDVVTFC